MTLTPDDGPDENARQRTRDQYALLTEIHGESLLIDTDDPADFGFICRNDSVLVGRALRDGEDGEDPVTLLTDYLTNTRAGDFGPMPPQQEQSRTGLGRRFTLPARLNPSVDGRDLLATLAEIDAQFGPGFATPDHLVHICGKGLICPAAEPAETGDTLPFPYLSDDPDAGDGVDIVVIDTGWYDPSLGPQATAAATPWSWLSGVTGEPERLGVFEDPATQLLYPYAGHGTFAAGVIRAVAPACRIHVLNLDVDQTVHGGGVHEADLVDRLYDALRDMEWLDEEDPRREDGHVWPDIISMSAGCPTRLDLPSVSFEHWGQDLAEKGADLVLVAAAGNNATAEGFWPASFDWATGVGSVDRDGTISDFSNYGSSVDVLALGRDVINAFPNGTYKLREGIDKDKTRSFTNYMATWSGTSFSTPLVTGLIAAELSRQSGFRSATQAQKDVLLAATLYKAVDGARSVPLVGSQFLY
ncbi:MAG TPA: S8/S53 family peptidase [Nocardioides sp.]|uniref:S8 family peptidase n=1 Tax=uncultured Nocardioides sp. TaxID=198441 RepID=UPI000EEA2FEC|nr:S8/S53 family peptidase [uncultured Nocardioides sp.]HCB05588.1 hypothetical protein [Nocardioides sp.]HRD62660.1 S8/S53 family peptidase [Nocardioides sp.]HRI97281.1 S8/S53 family peptidase [Nocardioides sp.]HRK46840.1 S8/S53 family peptidase [Nocardioides sp.]